MRYVLYVSTSVSCGIEYRSNGYAEVEVRVIYFGDGVEVSGGGTVRLEVFWIFLDISFIFY